MRIHIALALYVSLTAAASAEDTNNMDWAAIHAAGIGADERQNHEQALEYFTQSWSSALTPEQQGVSANDIGQAYRELKRPKQAKVWLERAWHIWRENPGANRHLAVTASSLAEVYRDTGDYAAAEALLREALGACTNDLDSADAIRNDLADLLREEGRSTEARNLFSASLQRDGISLQQRVNALTGLADIDRQQGNREASTKEWNEVLEISRSYRDDLSEGIASRGLALLWLSTGNLARAEPLFRRALAIVENNPAAAPQDVATALFNMAQLYRAQNKFALAEDAWSKALQLERTVFGDLHPQIATVMAMLAEVYSKLGEHNLARDYATNAVDSMRSLFGENAVPTAVAFLNRATVEQELGDPGAAVKDYERAFAITRALAPHSELQRTLIERYAGLLKTMHRNREAKEISMLTFVPDGTVPCKMCDNPSPQ
ncbi:MAG TPA: tetratricopeptide repeat protein [Bryobacteraceae bacterium]|jgi:tetratricopeptide (TPR) repeat protein|nr:tetratricopeptide repeat protein [Bryobacteraceae bacterium]